MLLELPSRESYLPISVLCLEISLCKKIFNKLALDRYSIWTKHILVQDSINQTKQKGIKLGLEEERG